MDYNLIVEDKVHEISGPALLLAGPGTGKTERLAKRIKWLVSDEKKVKPEHITVITFTRLASREMRERISDPNKKELFVHPDKQPKMIRTMHSLCHEIITENGEGTKSDDKLHVIQSDTFRDILVGDAAQLANSDFAREDSKETVYCRKFGDCNPTGERKCEICESYRCILDCCSAIDYDEQILLACKRLEDDKQLLNKYRSYCQHLLVDEYQDINARQFKLIQLLSEGQREGLFVVGDDDQSIYSWRGGSPKYIRNFQEDFGAKAQKKPLTVSHRCPLHILEGAMAVVAKYDKKERLPKEKFEYKKGDGEKIKIHSVPSDEVEAEGVRIIVERAVKQSKDVLILFPYKSFSEDIAKELQKARIQYDAQAIIPGEGLPLISVLSQWLANTSDSLAFRKSLQSVIRNPYFDIPTKAKKPETRAKREDAFLRISNLWKSVIEEKVDSYWESLKLEKENNELYSKLFSTFEHLQIHNSQEEPAGLAAEIIKTLVPWRKSQSFLDEVDSWVQTAKRTDSTGQSSSVQLMTWQSAKGLGANVVCIVGVEEGTLPKGKGEVINIAEESRKFLVSLTRASEEVHVFHARKRSQHKVRRKIYTKRGTPDIEPSRFLKAIPEEHKESKFHPVRKAK